MSATVVDVGDGLPITVGDLMRARVQERPDHAMLVCDDERLTYAEADRRSAELARRLLVLGAGKGTHVGILEPNGAGFVTAWLAAARIGAVSVPLSTFSTAPELATLLRNADVAVLLSTAGYRSHDYVSRLAAAVPEIDFASPAPLQAESMPCLRRILFVDGAPDVDPSWTIDGALAGADPADEDVLRAAEELVTPADRMLIVHTSGSTSAPKGVIHSHGTIIRHLDNLNEIRRLGTDDILFSNSPFFWVGGVGYSLLGVMIAGATLVCSNSTSASDVLDVLERERPTMCNGYAAVVAHLTEDPSFAGRDLSSLRRGNLFPLMPAEVRPPHPALRHQMLGMTETASVCLASADDSDQPESRRGSFGKPVPGIEARVVSVDDGSDCGPSELGELWVRGPFMMEGYYGFERHEVFDADGWYHSGDLVVVDEDGFFYFKGRSGDMIKTAGANVSPWEVEDAIRDATGLTAHVVGLDDEERGQIVVAAVPVPAGRDVDVDALKGQLAVRLSSYKRPRRVVLIGDDEVPLMSSGKVDQRALKDLLRDR